jgi:hypothetical protein
MRPSEIEVLAKVPDPVPDARYPLPLYRLGSVPKRWIVHAKQIA